MKHFCGFTAKKYSQKPKSEHGNIFDSRVTKAALNPADVSGVKSGSFGEFLLG